MPTLHHPPLAALPGPCLARRALALVLLGAALLMTAATAPLAARAQVTTPAPVGLAPADDLVLQAREAHRARDKARLAALRTAAVAAGHPLAMWVEYWELHNRLGEAQQPELDAFAARWRGSYVEDRLRNDWLLELGRRRDWANFRAEYPRFRMNDDREVSCYALAAQLLDGQDVRAAAGSAWLGLRDADDGCHVLGQTLHEARPMGRDELWAALRVAVENNRPRAARAAAAIVSASLAQRIDALFKEPTRVLHERRATAAPWATRLQVLALWRLAAADPDAAAAQIERGFHPPLPAPELADAWAGVARQAALRTHPRAAAFSRSAWRAWDQAGKTGQTPPWSDDTLGWLVRAALRASGDPGRWALVLRSVDAMGETERRDPAWQYWRARALLAQAAAGAEGEGERVQARAALQGLASPFTFYGQLALEDLGQRPALPAPPVPLSSAEREGPRSQPGLARALQLIALGLRNEGVREWNFSLRGMAERELLAAAHWACEREVWDRCINTSDRTKAEVDLAQRYPTPFRDQVLTKAAEVGIDPAFVYGLIRQESRFVLDARSSVGASGLMQLMPATARWTARKVGLEWRQDLLTDRDVNLRLGMTYLKLLMDDFDGSAVMATAAYNAGPGRPRRWREGSEVEPAAWIEGIPFHETRDYVKKVLSNSVVYSTALGAPLPPLKARLGTAIGPRDPRAPVPNADLP